MRHFIYHPEKNLSKRHHDCLIVDWEEFLKSEHRDKAIYDFISTLDLLQSDK